MDASPDDVERHLQIHAARERERVAREKTAFEELAAFTARESELRVAAEIAELAFAKAPATD